MSTYQLKDSSTTLNRMGYGSMKLAGDGVWGPPRDENEAIAILRAAVESGVNHIDTAAFYGPDVVNQLIKKALHPYPAGLTIVTKIGFVRGPDKSWKPAQSSVELEAAVHENLETLGLEALDVVNLRLGDAHGPNDESIAERVESMARLQKKGLIRHIGLSTVSAKQIAEAEKVAPIACVQNLYNVAHRDDDALIDDLAKKGIAYVPYFPLGGFTPLQSGALDEVARGLGKTPMQVALAWLLSRSPNILLIPGTSSLAHFRENFAAASITLTPEAKKALDGLSASRT